MIWNKLSRSIPQRYDSGDFNLWFGFVAFRHNRWFGTFINWYIWKMRNMHFFFFYLPIFPTPVIVQSHITLFNCNVAHAYLISVTDSGMPNEAWTPPPDGWLKLNFNDKVNLATQRAGIGASFEMMKEKNVASTSNWIASPSEKESLFCKTKRVQS